MSTDHGTHLTSGTGNIPVLIYGHNSVGGILVQNSTRIRLILHFHSSSGKRGIFYMFQESLLQKALGPFAAQRLGQVLGKQSASKLKLHFFNIFYTLNWKTNKLIWEYWWKGAWEHNQKPSKESRWVCNLLSWFLQSWLQPTVCRWIPSQCWSHSSANAQCLWPRALPFVYS